MRQGPREFGVEAPSDFGELLVHHFPHEGVMAEVGAGHEMGNDNATVPQ